MNSSLLRARIAFALLLLFFFNDGTSARRRTTRKIFPSPSSSNKRIEDNSMLAELLIPPEKDMDPCLHKNTYHARAECIQPLLETYYGKKFTIYCPGFSLLLAQGACRGCPWSKINPGKLPEIGNKSFPLQPGHQYFRNVTHDCRVAQSAKRFIRHSTVFIRSGFLGLFITVYLGIISFLGEKSGSDDGKLKPVIICGGEVSEARFLTYIWTLFYSLNLYFAFSNDYYKYCESLSSYYTQYMLKIAAYSTTLLISFSRCLRLWHRETSNWGFVFWRKKYPRERSNRVRGLSFVVQFLIFALFAALMSDQFMLMFPPKVDLWCSAGQRDYAMGLTQYSKLVLEFLAVIVFASNTKSRPCAERLSYICIAVIHELSWTAAVLCIFFYKLRGHSMLIPIFLDQESACVSVQFVHINVISLLGIFEMLIPPIEENPMAGTESSAS